MKNTIRYINFRAACYLLELAEEGKIHYTSLAVGIALASFLDANTFETTIDKPRLAKRAGGMSLETLRKHLRMLEDVGFLNTKRRGKKKSNRYRVRIPQNLTSMITEKCGFDRKNLGNYSIKNRVLPEILPVKY